MSALPEILKTEWIQKLAENEIEQITQASIDQIAIPFIVSHDLAQAFHIGYFDPNKKPFSEEKKLIIYKRIALVIKPRIIKKITNFVYTVLEESLQSFRDEELKIKANELNSSEKDIKPNWSYFKSIVQNETFLFEQLESKTLLKVNLVTFYHKLSPILSKLGDSPEFLARINIDEILNLSYEQYISIAT